MFDFVVVSISLIKPLLPGDAGPMKVRNCDGNPPCKHTCDSSRHTFPIPVSEHIIMSLKSYLGNILILVVLQIHIKPSTSRFSVFFERFECSGFLVSSSSLQPPSQISKIYVMGPYVQHHQILVHRFNSHPKYMYKTRYATTQLASAVYKESECEESIHIYISTFIVHGGTSHHIWCSPLFLLENFHVSQRKTPSCFLQWVEYWQASLRGRNRKDWQHQIDYQCSHGLIVSSNE